MTALTANQISKTDVANFVRVIKRWNFEVEGEKYVCSSENGEPAASSTTNNSGNVDSRLNFGVHTQLWARRRRAVLIARISFLIFGLLVAGILVFMLNGSYWMAALAVPVSLAYLGVLFTNGMTLNGIDRAISSSEWFTTGAPL